MGLWKRRNTERPSAIDPLASKENADAFGIASGVAQAIGADPLVTGAAALYAKAEAEERALQEHVRNPHSAGSPPRGANRAGDRRRV